MPESSYSCLPLQASKSQPGAGKGPGVLDADSLTSCSTPLLGFDDNLFSSGQIIGPFPQCSLWSTHRAPAKRIPGCPWRGPAVLIARLPSPLTGLGTKPFKAGDPCSLTHLPRQCFWFSLQSSRTASIHPDHHLLEPTLRPLPPPGTCARVSSLHSSSIYCRWSCQITHLITSLLCLPWLPHHPQVQGQTYSP